MAAITVEYVRKYLLDFPFENLKHDDKYFEDSMIEDAIADAQERAVEVPPLGSSTVIPRYLIRYGAIGILFEQKFLNSAINFNPGIYENGLQEPVGAEAQLLKTIADQFNSMFIQNTTSYKIAINMAGSISAYGGPGAPISSWFHRNSGSGGGRWG